MALRFIEGLPPPTAALLITSKAPSVYFIEGRLTGFHSTPCRDIIV